jgi:hypothetical protein
MPQTQVIIALASQYGRYGYRRIKSLLDEAGWDGRRIDNPTALAKALVRHGRAK